MNIAGDSDGMKKRRSEFSIPIIATATATVVRNGAMTRVSCVVSSSLPGTSANSEAMSAVIGPANTMARRDSVPVMTSSALMTRLPSRQACSRPRVSMVRVNAGTNAAVIAPSAKRSRSRLGMRKATLNASIAALAPKKYARTVSRTTPSTRLAIVARLMRPADRARRELIEEGKRTTRPRCSHPAVVDTPGREFGNACALRPQAHTKKGSCLATGA